jgi:hypothetical protein
LGTGSAFADLTVTLTQTGLGNANGGGVFSAVTSANGTFNTFCLSIGTVFSPGTQYNYTVDPTIKANTAPPNGSPIAYGAADLYNAFLHGANNSSAGANGVQAAIWFCQQDSLLAITSTYGSAAFNVIDTENGADLTALITSVLDPLGLTQAQLQANGNGAFGVEAMNLYTGSPNDKNYAQPQIIQVPEASTMIAGALLLLPLGVSALRIVRKNRIA